MTLPQYLCTALSLGLSRKDALLMEIAAVYEMARIQAERMERAKK